MPAQAAFRGRQDRLCLEQLEKVPPRARAPCQSRIVIKVKNKRF